MEPKQDKSNNPNASKLPIQRPQFGNPRMPNMGSKQGPTRPGGNFVKPALVKRAAKGR